MIFCLVFLEKFKNIREKWLADFYHLSEKYSLNFNKSEMDRKSKLATFNINFLFTLFCFKGKEETEINQPKTVKIDNHK